MKRCQKGFSLIELLIVVAIILIIAAIAIPNLLRARMQANEASAVSSIHSINTAELSYSSTFPAVGYAAALANLGDGGTTPCPGTSAASCYLDSVLVTGHRGDVHQGGGELDGGGAEVQFDRVRFDGCHGQQVSPSPGG